MNCIDMIKWMGTVNAKKCYPKELDKINKTLPYFEVQKNECGRYDVIKKMNYLEHDNAPRMDFVIKYLQQNIFPNIDKACNLSGFYNIELHDSFSYLENGNVYEDVLGFGGLKNNNLPGIMMPDTYMMGNWGNQHDYISDNIQFEDKIKKVVWVGTTTGSRVARENKRIQTCIWALDKKNMCDFNITNVAQMAIPDILNAVPRFAEIYKPRMKMEDQMKYRYHLTIDGNASPWNVVEYFTNSLILKYASNNMLWYYPLLQDRHHYVEVDVHSLEKEYIYYENNVKEAMNIVSNSNKLARELFKPFIVQQYCVSLFEGISQNGK